MTRSISKSGAAELGEPFYTRQQLGHFHDGFVDRLRAAIAAGSESAVEGVNRWPGTRRPQPFDSRQGVLP
jgi:hypothetical protein